MRSAIALLLQDPSLAQDTSWPPLFAALRQPGVNLLVELVCLVRDRPQLTTGALLEYFAEREEAAALQKLALQTLPGDSALWRTEWRDVLDQLDQQTLQQRVEELKARQSEAGLSDEEKDELRQLMKLIARR